MEFREVYERYKSDLTRVEAVLYESVKSDNRLLQQSATHLLEAGGKRIRPLFAILCSRGDSLPSEKSYPLAAALELVHMATLVHDDVIDDSQIRRGRPTVRASFGNRPAMYTGDFLFARAIQLLVSIGDPRVHLELSSAIVRMVEGEIDQIQDFFNWRQTLRSYLRRIERKTALLISVSCSLGGLIGGMVPSVVITLRRFGYYTGMAFQIIDDILDYTADAQILGKPVGGDLRQGNITLPALYAAQCTPVGERLRDLLQQDIPRDDVKEAIGLVLSTDAIDYTRRIANQYMAKALECLEKIPFSYLRDELETVAAFVNHRAYLPGRA